MTRRAVRLNEEHTSWKSLRRERQHQYHLAFGELAPLATPPKQSFYMYSHAATTEVVRSFPPEENLGIPPLEDHLDSAGSDTTSERAWPSRTPCPLPSVRVDRGTRDSIRQLSLARRWEARTRAQRLVQQWSHDA